MDQAQQSQRLRQLAGLCWVLGLSYRGIAGVFPVFRAAISRMSAWRDAQEQAEQLKRRRMWKPVRVLGLDGAYVRAWGDVRPVFVAVDLGEGQPVALGYVDEHNPQAVCRFLEPLDKRLGVSVIVTDDLLHYKTVAEKLELEHQICQFHVRRWVGRARHKLRPGLPTEWQGVLEEVHNLVAELPSVIGLGPALSRLQARMLELLPGKLMTRDNLLSMQLDNVCDCAFPDVLGFSPSPLEAVVPTYIAGVTPRSRYRWFRFRARR